MGWTVAVAANLDNLENVEDSILSEFLRAQLEQNGDDEEGLKELAEEILRSATMMSAPNEKLFGCFELLVTSQADSNSLTSCVILPIVVDFNAFEKYPCMSAILRFLRGYLPSINCSQFDNTEKCTDFVTKLLALFKWFFTAFQTVMKNYSGAEIPTTEVALNILRTVNTYLEDPFIMKTLQIVARKRVLGGLGKSFDGMKALAKQASVSPKISKEFDVLQNNTDQIHAPMEKLPLHYFNTIGGLQRRPAIRSLTAIFMGYRVLCPAGEIAETIELVGTINDYGKTQVAVDILHGGLLIMVSVLFWARQGQFQLEEFPQTPSHDHPKAEDHERVPLDVYKLNLSNIFFKKLPQVFEILINRGYLSLNDIVIAVDTIIRTFKVELDQLDFALRVNTMRLFLEAFVENGRINREMFEKINQPRAEQIKMNAELNSLILRSSVDENKAAPMLGLRAGKKAYETVKGRAISQIDQVMRGFIKSDTFLFDGLCSWYSVEGDILDLTRKFASMVWNSEEDFKEQGKNNEDNLDTFGIYFMLLARISWYFPNLSLEDLVTGSTGSDVDNMKCGYYTWTKSHVRRIVPKEEEPSSSIQDNKGDNPEGGETKEETKEEPMEAEEQPETTSYSEEMRQKCLNLAHRVPFWNREWQSPTSMIDLVPTIGEVWLNEYKAKALDVEMVKELFIVLQEFPVMVLCLAQWLENQPFSPQRFSMGKYLLEVVNNWQHNYCKRGAPLATPETMMWQLLWLQCKLHLGEIEESPLFVHPMSVFQKSVANRTLPKCGRYEVPHANMMKDAWIYCQRQNWFSIRPLVLIDHSNKSNNPRSWINGLMYNILKLETQDSVAKAIEMLTTIILLDPVRAAVKAIEVIIDLLLVRDPTKTPDKPTMMQVPECTMPLVQAVIQAMIIGVWLVNRKSHPKEPEQKRRRSSVELEQPWKSLMMEDADELDVLNAFITNAINCLVSETLSGVMRPASSVIYHMLNLIARSPKNKFRDMLIKRIPQNMIFRLAVVDPHALPLEVFAEFCEHDQPGHSESQLQYLFLLRKCGGI